MIYIVKLISVSIFQKYIHFPKRLFSLREYPLLEYIYWNWRGQSESLNYIEHIGMNLQVVGTTFTKPWKNRYINPSLIVTFSLPLFSFSFLFFFCESTIEFKLQKYLPDK